MRFPLLGYCWLVLLLLECPVAGQQQAGQQQADQQAAEQGRRIVLADGNQFPPLTEPPCSYCSTQHLKSLIKPDDRVIAWLRASHNGGAIPIRHFLAAPRVINDTYGLFFYDPDGGYVAAYRKDYGYRLYGWRRGVMVVQSKDGTLWSALTGLAFEGPRKGEQLQRIPSLVTNWSHWMMLHPESTAYDLYDGKRYPMAPLPVQLSSQARQSMGDVDPRLPAMANVLGVASQGRKRAYPLDDLPQRACLRDTLSEQPLAVFWYKPTNTAVAYRSVLDGRRLTFYADDVSPESAPFKDKETGTRWTLAGRGVDGPLKGEQLQWADSIQCRWYAWSAEQADTSIYATETDNQDEGQENPPANDQRAEDFRGVLLRPDAVNDQQLQSLRSSGFNAVVLSLSSDANQRRLTTAAVAAIRARSFQAHYWVEVGRCPELADAHPRWMASLQGHQQWRRLFNEPVRAAAGQVVKNYPWVPILYRESFDAQLTRIGALLDGLPEVDGVWLNDLQGAPSACGCGNTLCRWTADYGKILTATPLGETAAADFTAEVAKLVPRSEIIPVWLTECEEHDGAKDGAARAWAAIAASAGPNTLDNYSP